MFECVWGGALKQNMQMFCRKHGLEEVVVFHGIVNREVVQLNMRNTHLNLIPSLSEATSTILWEATAKGIPSLVLNHYGMADILTKNSSFLIDVNSQNRIVKDIAVSLIDILNNPNIITLKSKETIKLAKKYSWEKQLSFFDKVYDMAIINFERKNGKTKDKI